MPFYFRFKAAHLARLPRPTATLSGLILLIVSTLSHAQPTPDALADGFRTPPLSAKPRVWWHWMNGNVTRTGITKDLEWMKRVGIGGMQMFEASLGTPRVVEQPVVYLTPEWREAVKHTAQEASRLGLEFTLSAAGGWSQSGGPMVTPAEAMKKIVWSETPVVGGKPFAGMLPMPPTNNGTFLDKPASNGIASVDPAKQDPTFYKDSRVVAYRLPDNETRLADAQPVITSSSPIDAPLLYDGKIAKNEVLKAEEGTAMAWVQFAFARPYTANAISIAASPVATGIFSSPATGQVLASADGRAFYPILTFPGSVHRPSPVRTYTIAETTARYFRVEFRAIPRNEYDIVAGINSLFGPPKPPTVYNVAEIDLHSTARVNQWQDKAAYGLMYDYQLVPTPATAQAIDKQAVIDLTDRMKPDGSLAWDAPAGNWVVLRMGYSLTGQKNGPAPPELTGYEVDKLSKAHVVSYLDKYLKPYLAAMDGKQPDYLLLDSWEANVQNWTDTMMAAFAQRNGYDPAPYLPVLTGRVVGSADQSDRFLWDFRNTISDLIAENHYATATDYLHKRGIKVYGEAIGTALGTMGDGLKSKGRVDIPMCEFWTENPDGFRDEHPADVLEAASAAHIYDKTLVACESFTDIKRPFGPPAYLKYLADHYMALGVNRFVVHTSVHQPLDDKKPGMTLSIFGQHYTRQNTWAEQSVAWNSYLSRSSYLLQQGKSVSDIAYFVGEDAPAVSPFWEKLKPAISDGYKVDLVSTEVILTRMRVENGQLVLPDGVTYRALVLPDKTERMTVGLLQKIRELVAAGAVLIGPKPSGSPSLTDYPMADKTVETIATDLWGMTNGHTITAGNYGKGRVFWGKPIADVMAALQTAEDVAYTKPNLNTKLSWIHRQLSTEPIGGRSTGGRLGDIYFVANQQYQPENLLVRFRVADKRPELWHSDTGTTSPVSYTIANGFTTVPLALDPYGSVFVVFREPTTQVTLTLPVLQTTVLQPVVGTWQVRFPNLFNNTTALTMNSLQSWPTLPDTTLRYFSGTATYTNTVVLATKEPGKRLLLDLGDVKEIAEVTLNGKPLGILWKTPFRVDITDAATVGKNTLEVRVTNLWTNRMEGDKNLPPTQRFTFATNTIFGRSLAGPTIALIPSGLLGPVQILVK